MLVGLLVVVFAFGLAQPIAALASTATRSAIGIAVAVVLLAFLTMITRRKAMSQVVGFLSMENGLFFGAMSATYGMPMIVELGVALDVLVAMLVLGVFFFQIREQFDSLDLHHLEVAEGGDLTWSSCCCSRFRWRAPRCSGVFGARRWAPRAERRARASPRCSPPAR